jgi:hypothetical protein
MEDIVRFRVPADVVNATDEALREAGAAGAERFVLWVGRAERSVFSVRHAYVPAQTAHRLPDGLCVTVDGDELHRLNKWLYENQMTLGVQVHTHPTRAYHSDTDSTYPIVTQRGGVSIVVPDFAAHGLRGRGVECYRLAADGWQHLRKRAVRALIELDDDGKEIR